MNRKGFKSFDANSPNFLFYKITSFHSAFVLEQQALIQCWISCEFSNICRNDMSSVDLYYILIWVQGSKQIVFVLASTRTRTREPPSPSWLSPAVPSVSTVLRRGRLLILSNYHDNTFMIMIRHDNANTEQLTWASSP